MQGKIRGQTLQDLVILESFIQSGQNHHGWRLHSLSAFLLEALSCFSSYPSLPIILYYKLFHWISCTTGRRPRSHLSSRWNKSQSHILSSHCSFSSLDHTGGLHRTQCLSCMVGAQNQIRCSECSLLELHSLPVHKAKNL